MSWPTELLQTVATTTLGKMLDAKKNRGELRPYLANVNVRWGEFELSDLREMRFQDSELDRFGLTHGDIVMCEGGEPGRCAIWKDQLPTMMVQKALHRIRAGERMDYRFLFYVFLHQGRIGAFSGLFTGATIKHLPKDKLAQIRVPVPPLPIQRRIADILSAYDDLIENNTRRIAILEDMARRLFEEWFVRPFDGNERLPDGWKLVGLKDVAEVSYGFAFKSKLFSAQPPGTPVVRIRDVPDGRSGTWTQEAFDPKYSVRNGDILIGMDGIFHMSQWSGGNAALNQRVARLRPKGSFSRGFVFLSAYPHIKFFEATITGTTVAHLGAKHLDTIRLRVAPTDLQSKLDRSLSDIDDQILSLRLANTNLRTTRDLLLPKLISGEIEVQVAEEELETAAA